MYFRYLSLKHLDVEFSITNRVKIRIVERPGLWMSESGLKELLGELRSVVERCLGKASLEYGILSGAKSRLDNAIISLLYEKGSHRPIAFNAMSILDLDVRGEPIRAMHMGLAMIDPSFRRQGLSWVLYGLTCALLLIRNHLRPFWISNVTQIPSVVGHVAESLANVFPTPDPKEKRTSTHLAIARQIMHHHRAVFGVGDEAGFDEEKFIITNAYTGGSDNLRKSLADVPKHRDEDFNAMCRNQLDYDRGDDFLQIGQFNLRVARDCVVRSLPGASLSALAHQLASAALRPSFPCITMF